MTNEAFLIKALLNNNCYRK